MENEIKTDWFGRHKFITVAVVLLIIWGSLLIFFLNYATELRADPCAICSEKMGENILCTVKDTTNPISRTYYVNGSTSQTKPKVINPMANMNFTLE